MATNVLILSREFVKPSTPTPHKLHEIRFSGLDQLYGASQFPTVSFVQHQPSLQMDNSTKSRHVKESLSLALTKFYPFAGELNGDSSVICNDTGALYVEAQVDANLLDSINNGQYFQYVGESCVPLTVQLTFFRCGGTALGIHYSHLVADGWTFAMFLNYWARISFGNPSPIIIVEPKFGLGHGVFPPPDRETLFKVQESKNKKMVLKRFLFGNKKIASLKKLASSGSCPPQNPSRVEVVSGFIWKQIIEMNKSKANPKSKFVARFAVNLRMRLDHPIDDSAMGNFVIISPVLSTLEDTETDYGFLIGELRKAANAFKTMEVGFDFVKYSVELFEAIKKPEVWSCMFSSLCGFPMYEVDFGWGRPLLVFPRAMPRPAVLLMNAKNGDGIEAWINLFENDMEMIPNELLSLESQTDSVAHVAHPRL